MTHRITCIRGFINPQPLGNGKRLPSTHDLDWPSRDRWPQPDQGGYIDSDPPLLADVTEWIAQVMDAISREDKWKPHSLEGGRSVVRNDALKRSQRDGGSVAMLLNNCLHEWERLDSFTV